MSNSFLSTHDGAIEIQKSGTGTGHRVVLDLTSDVKAALGGIEVPLGAVTRNYRLSARTNTFVPRPVRRDPPEGIEPELSMKMVARNWLEQHLDADARFTLYVRHIASGSPTRSLNYARVDILSDAAPVAFNYSDFQAAEDSEEDLTITMPFNAAKHLVIWPVEGLTDATGWASADDCAVVDAALDDDGTLYAVTAADGVGGSPFLLIRDTDGAWSEVELTDLSADCAAITIAGDYLVIAATTTLALYTKAGVQVSTYTATGNVAALASIDAANIVAIGASGLLLQSEDGGSNWTAITSGSSAALGSLACRSLVDWWIGGASGTLLHYVNGALSTITLPTGPASATISAIALPDSPAGFSRDETVYIGCADGTVWKTGDHGDNWAQVSFPGDAAGAVADIAFTGFLGQVLFVLHTPAAGSSVLYRDWSGGAGGVNNMEAVSIPANSGLTRLVVADPNSAFLLGSVHDGAEMVVKVGAA